MSLSLLCDGSSGRSAAAVGGAVAVEVGSGGGASGAGVGVVSAGLLSVGVSVLCHRRIAASR